MAAVTHDARDPREIAQKRLEELVGGGELSLSEFSDRASKIWAATSPAELDVAMSGLPRPLDPRSVSASATASPDRQSPQSPQPAGGAPGGGMIRVEQDAATTKVFEDIKREGRWHLPEEYKLTSWFGDIFVDLRDAVVDAPRTHLQLDAWAAEGRVLLPPGVSVAVSGNRTWCTFKVDEGNYEVRGGPHIDLELNGFMATFKVKVLESGQKIPKSWKWF